MSQMQGSKSDEVSNYAAVKDRQFYTHRREFRLHRLPPLLIMQLKRFHFDATHRQKINRLVEFPIDSLDMSSYRSSSGLPLNENEDGLYDLFGVIHHIGILGGGHYTSTIRHPPLHAKGRSMFDRCSEGCDGTGEKSAGTPSGAFRWHSYNDTEVSPVNESNVIAPTAYVLFYIRRDLMSKSLDDILLRQEIASHLTEARAVVEKLTQEDEAKAESVEDNALPIGSEQEETDEEMQKELEERVDTEDSNPR